MGRKNRSPEENERRAKIRELLQARNISSMDDIQNLFKKICPNIIADVRIQFYHNTADTAIQNQADCKTSCHNSKNHARFVHLISGNNINQIFSCNAAEKSKRGTYHSEKCIKKDGPSISDTVMQNPFPVINDL